MKIMVEKSLIKQLILEYQEFATNVKFLPRAIEVDYGHCNVFVGLRRAGKSYLMYQCIHHMIDEGLSPRSVLFFNFEDDRLPPLTLSDLDTIKLCYEEMFAEKPVFFLDELQLVQGWERFARRLADTGYRVFVTGSNAKMLSSEIASTLGGRYALTEVFPFSFREFLEARGVVLKPNWQYLNNPEIVRAFEEYFVLGGLPEVVETAPQFKRKWLSSLFDRIYFGDLIARNGIRKQDVLKTLIRKLAETVGEPLSLNRAAAIVSSTGMSVKPDSVADYLDYMEQSWLTFPIENFAAKLTEKLNLKKYYFIDNGFITLFKERNDGALLENLAAISMRRRFGRDFYYYKQNVEVDFYVPVDDIAVQVSYSLSDEGTRRRELGALEAMHRFRPLKKAVILTWDEELTLTTENGLQVSVLPFWKWLADDLSVSYI